MLHGMAASDIDMNAAQNEVTGTVCGTPALKATLDRDIKIEYHYAIESSESLFFVVDKGDCM
jgi:hypothetical protein